MSKEDRWPAVTVSIGKTWEHRGREMVLIYNPPAFEETMRIARLADSRAATNAQLTASVAAYARCSEVADARVNALTEERDALLERAEFLEGEAHRMSDLALLRFREGEEIARRIKGQRKLISKMREEYSNALQSERAITRAALTELDALRAELAARAIDPEPLPAPSTVSHDVASKLFPGIVARWREYVTASDIAARLALGEELIRLTRDERHEGFRAKKAREAVCRYEEDHFFPMLQRFSRDEEEQVPF